MITRPLFLVGAERSGTTMLRLMLDHHPRIAFFFEFDFATDLMVDRDKWPDLAGVHAYLSTHRGFEELALDVDEGLSYPKLMDSFLRQKRDRDGKDIVGATLHRHFERVLRLCPHAGFIHLLRDPRDVARSRVQMGSAGNTWVAAGAWVEAERSWDALTRHVDHDSWIELRYEDLVVEPAPQLTRVCEFIGVDFSPSMLGYHRDSTYAPPDPTLAQRWMREAAVREVQLTETRVGELLGERGYTASGLPRLEVSPKMERRLARQSRRKRAMFRMSRYGLPLYCAQVASRRLPWESWRRRVQARVNTVDGRNLK